MMNHQVPLMNPQTRANGTLSSNATVISLLAIREMMNQHKDPDTSPSKNLFREKRWGL